MDRSASIICALKKPSEGYSSFAYAREAVAIIQHRHGKFILECKDVQVYDPEIESVLFVVVRAGTRAELSLLSAHLRGDVGRREDGKGSGVVGG